MLRIKINKSRSKSFAEAERIVLSLGGKKYGNYLELVIPEHEIPGAYQNLLPLIRIISKWKGVEATYNNTRVNLYRFIFLQYHQVAECGTGKTDESYCSLQSYAQNWGCRLIGSLQLHTSGSGVYEKSNRYWYNYGSFDVKGRWIIDKNRIYSKIMDEVERRHLDICPHFDATRIHHTVFVDLPGVIIPDNYNYLLHYERVYEDGREFYKAVNIRHIEDLRRAPGLINRRLLHRIYTAMDHFKVDPPDMPDQLRQKLLTSASELIETRDAPIFKAFDKDGLGKN